VTNFAHSIPGVAWYRICIWSRNCLYL